MESHCGHNQLPGRSFQKLTKTYTQTKQNNFFGAFFKLGSKCSLRHKSPSRSGVSFTKRPRKPDLLRRPAETFKNPAKPHHD